jgi:hypothetical protein
MSEISAEPSLSEEEIWKSHILKARASRLSDVKYCQKYELSVWRFTTFKKKLGLTKPKRVACGPKLNAFTKVVPAESEVRPDSAVTTSSLVRSLPDARWMAEFVLALLGQR